MEQKRIVDDTFQRDATWLIDNFDKGVYISDLNTYEILYMNQACKRIVGIADDVEVEGRLCYEVWQNTDVPCSFCTNAFLSENKYYVWERYNPYLHRNTILRDCLIYWKDRLSRMEIVIDISTQEAMERVITDKIHIENTLLDCISTIVNKESAGGTECLLPVLSAIGAFYHADRAYILEYNETHDQLMYTYQWVDQGVPADDTSMGIRIPISKGLKQAVERNIAYLIRDIDDLKELNPDEYQRQQQRGVHSLYGVPLVDEDRLVGYLCIDNPNLNIENYSLLRTLGIFISNQLSKVKLYEKQRYDVFHDVLTGLLNRNSYTLFLAEQESAPCLSIGVAYVDINGLGRMNQDLGQAYGDEIVRQVSRTLSLQFDVSGGYIFRFEGDEFIVICRDISYEEFQTRLETTSSLLDKIIPHGIANGYTWTSDGYKDIDSLLYAAHQSMIVNKRVYYAQHQRSFRYNDGTMRHRLQADLQQGKFMMYLQPKINIHTERLSGMEALSRYCGDNDEILLPGKFIPLLEREGLIRYVDFFVLDQACRTLADWKEKGYELFPISVNFSRVTIMESSAIDEIEAVVDAHGVPHQYILIEITETMGEMGWDMLVAIGTKLEKRGFGTSLDDFGSQYSCISLLAAMPFAEVKFDRSMIRRIDSDQKMRVLCESMMEASHKMHCPVLAEGVETKEQLELLRQFPCETVQGYYYSKPIPIAQFETIYYLEHKENCECK